MDNKVCPKCFMDMELRSISSFESSGLKYGAIWFCQYCGFHDLDNLVTVTDENKDLVLPAISFSEINYIRWKRGNMRGDK